MAQSISALSEFNGNGASQQYGGFESSLSWLPLQP